MSDHPDDADLFARLRGADPAASLPPLGPERTDRLLEDTMSHDTESRQAGPRDRNPLTWLVAAAAAAVIAGVVAFTLVDRADETPAVTAQPEPTSEPTADAPGLTRLTLPERGAGRCMVPNADTLATAAYAFDGVVSGIEDGVVTLEVSQWYTGGPTEEVEVAQSSADRSALIGAPRFAEGERYLVAGSDDGDVMVCGFSAPHEPDLARLYEKAFGG